MNAIGTVFRFMAEVIKHPATQKILNHAVRVATAELVRHIQKKTRGRKTRISYS